jgi:prophage regulatory protein
MENLFLRPKAVALKLGISTTTIWRWVKNANMHFPQPIKLTPMITVFNASEIDAWHKKQCKNFKEAENA